MKLTGCLATLNRFISKLRERGAEFFKLLKKQDKFQWTEKAQVAFDNLKIFLTTPHVLTAPILGEELLLYISATTNVVVQISSLNERRRLTSRRSNGQYNL